MSVEQHSHVAMKRCSNIQQQQNIRTLQRTFHRGGLKAYFRGVWDSLRSLFTPAETGQQRARLVVAVFAGKCGSIAAFFAIAFCPWFRDKIKSSKVAVYSFIVLAFHALFIFIETPIYQEEISETTHYGKQLHTGTASSAPGQAASAGEKSAEGGSHGDSAGNSGFDNVIQPGDTFSESDVYERRSTATTGATSNPMEGAGRVKFAV